jgi:hypothetical protein
MPRQTDTVQTVRLPLFGSPTNRSDDVDFDQRFVNCFPEFIDNPLAGVTRIYIQKRAGTSTHIRPSGTTGEGRGIWSWDGRLYSIIGDKVYSNSTAIKTLTTSTGACGATAVTAATDYLFICDGVKGYLIDTTNVVTEITDIDFPTPHVATPVFMDGYIFLPKTTGEVYNSNLNAPLLWEAVDFITPEAFPDGVLGLARQNNQVVSLNEQSIEFFYNSGNATGSPLLPTQQAVIQFGCASIGSVAEEENLIVTVAQSGIGSVFVAAIDGYKPDVISTSAIDRILKAEGDDIIDCWGYLSRIQGHLFYVLNLPSNSRTLVYDFNSKMWHEWAWTYGVNQILFPMIESAELGQELYFLHQANGYIYKMDPDLYQDAGTAIQTQIQTSKYDGETTKLKFMHRLSLVADYQSSASSINLYYSDDDYKNWKGPRTMDLIGRAYLYRLGSFRRRAFQLIHTANTNLRLEAIELELSTGVH